MKPSDYIPLSLLVAVFAFVGYQAFQTNRVTAVTQAAVLAPSTSVERTAPAETREAATHTAVEAAALDLAPAADPVDAAARDIDDVRRELSLRAEGTYIDEILTERDSALARWPERVTRPIRVWVASGKGMNGWDDVFPSRVREAFQEWADLGIPVHFTFVVDSSAADVHVSWIDHFEDPISGKTLWARDRDWWIVSANITLALHHNHGAPLDDRAVKAIALHEVGHLLGLDHTTDTANIMTPRVRVRDLSDADRATVELLYALPPGSLK